MISSRAGSWRRCSGPAGLGGCVAGWLFAVAITVLLGSCTSLPVRLDSLWVQGRVYDVDTGQGVPGTEVFVAWRSGTFASGGSRAVPTDDEGRYELKVDFDFVDGAVCGPKTFAMGILVVPGYEVLSTGDLVTCTEDPQTRDIQLRATEG